MKLPGSFGYGLVYWPDPVTLAECAMPGCSFPVADGTDGKCSACYQQECRVEQALERISREAAAKEKP